MFVMHVKRPRHGTKWTVKRYIYDRVLGTGKSIVDTAVRFEEGLANTFFGGLVA